MKKRSIVTGGSGFIGSHIVDKLIDLGHEVLVIDDHSATCHEYFYSNSKATYYVTSITNSNIEKLFEGVDYVFHLAAEARIQPSFENPELTINTNVLGTANVLKYAAKHNVKKVIYSSTSSSYGLINAIPLSEDMPTDCLTPYSITKVAGENLCKVYSRTYGLDTIILRYFNVYGGRQPTKGQYAPVVGLFQKQFKQGKPFTIVGDGLQSRDFTHISDVVEANVRAMKKDGWLGGEIFNIGTGKNFTMIDLISIIEGEGAVYTVLPERKGEARHTKADNSKAKRILNWEPKVKLEDWLNEF